MDRRPLQALFLLAAAASWVAPSASGAQACLDEVHAPDDPEDASIMMTQHRPVDPPLAVEILEVSLLLANDTLTHRVSLAGAPPFGNPVETYRYWLGFNVAGTGEGQDYVDVRVHGDADYAHGNLIGPNRLGNPRWGEYPVTWNGTTLQVDIPLRDLRAVLGDGLVVGKPTGTADGPSRMEDTQGIITGAIFYDYAGDFEEFLPLQECAQPTVMAPNDGQDSTQTSPEALGEAMAGDRSTPLTWILAGAGLAIAAIATRRQGLK